MAAARTRNMSSWSHRSVRPAPSHRSVRTQPAGSTGCTPQSNLWRSALRAALSSALRCAFFSAFFCAFRIACRSALRAVASVHPSTPSSVETLAVAVVMSARAAESSATCSLPWQTSAAGGHSVGCVTLLPGKMRSCALAVPLLRPLGPHTPSAKRLSNVLASRACNRSPVSLQKRRLCDVGGALVAASSVTSSSSPWSSPSEALPRAARGGLGCGGGGLRFDGGALARTSAADMTHDAIAANLAASSASESVSDADILMQITLQSR